MTNCASCKNPIPIDEPLNIVSIMHSRYGGKNHGQSIGHAEKVAYLCERCLPNVFSALAKTLNEVTKND